MKNNKKGFTLLELVIVILVTVIIFTSVIITGINLKKDAAVNPDAALVNTVNAMIKKSSTYVDGIDDVIAIMDENGYSEASLRVKLKDEHFGYDATNKRIFLVNNNGEVICSDKNVDMDNSYIVVFNEDDLVVNSKLYLYNDIDVTKDIVIINDHDIDLNGKKITSENVIYFQGKKPNTITISNGTIEAKELFLDEKNNTVVFGRKAEVYTKSFKSKSSVTLKENAILDISEKIELLDGVEFRVSGEHTINIPAKISYSSDVKVASSLTDVASTPYNEAEFVMVIVGEYNEKIHINSVANFIKDGDYYTLSDGYYYLEKDVKLDRPLRIKDGGTVTLNFGRNILSFTSEYGIINNGSLRIAGSSTSGKSAEIVACRYGIKNYGMLEIEDVNILVGNGDGETGYLTYNGNATIGIENLANDNVINIIKSTIKASTGIDSKSKCDINLKDVVIKANKFAVYALSGNINIGAVPGSKIDFNAPCLFGANEIKVTIGTKSSADSVINIENYTYYGEANNLVDYTKQR